MFAVSESCIHSITLLFLAWKFNPLFKYEHGKYLSNYLCGWIVWKGESTSWFIQFFVGMEWVYSQRDVSAEALVRPQDFRKCARHAIGVQGARYVTVAETILKPFAIHNYLIRETPKDHWTQNSPSCSNLHTHSI